MPVWIQAFKAAVFFFNRMASSAKAIVPTMKMNAAAAMAGLMFSRMVENICRASVRWFGPATNSVSTTSSSEVAKASTAPDSTPGMASGRVTRRNTVSGEAPRLSAASSTRRSMPASAPVTLTTTKGMATTL